MARQLLPINEKNRIGDILVTATSVIRVSLTAEPDINPAFTRTLFETVSKVWVSHCASGDVGS